MNKPVENLIFSTYGAQLGELAWHAIHADASIFEMSDKHAKSIINVVDRHLKPDRDRPIRILEIGAYAHFSAAKAADHFGGLGVSHDISPASLLVAQSAASKAGVKQKATMVAGDFHDLPFSDNYFDVVFCASCVHHTFRPWAVIAEMLRVTRPDGILHIQNEPIGRSAGFYMFRSNRADSFTPIESLMNERGSLTLFSSPFFGSRPESLFGMIENDRIPFDLMISALTDNADIVDQNMILMTAPIEEKLLKIPASPFMEGEVAALLLEERDALADLYTEDARRSGVRLPTDDEIWTKAYAMAPSLRKIAKSTGAALKEEMARTFGAAFTATIKKRGTPSKVDTIFRRPVTERNGIMDDLPTLPGVSIDFNNAQLPSIVETPAADLHKFYAPSEWVIFDAGNGIQGAMNLKPSSKITLPQFQTQSLLIMRFHCVHTPDHPYSVQIVTEDGTVVSSFDVVQTESRLVRSFLPTGTEALYVSTLSKEREPTDRMHHVRLAVVRALPIDITA